MLILKYFFYLWIVLIFVSCGQNESILTIKTIDSNLVVNTNIDTLKQNSNNYHWMTPEEFTPISFLNAVIINKSKDTLIDIITMFDNFPIDWVKESDIDTLVTLIKSTRQCKCFLNPYSSFIPTNENADIGGYAIIFISSFRHKNKINLGLYSCPKTENKSVTKIINWWANYKRTQ